jgi:hypothetical protein
VDNGGCGDSLLNFCENRCGSWPVCHKDVGRTDATSEVLDAVGTTSADLITLAPLCGEQNSCLSLVIQSNMSNPEEHCNKGFQSWCLSEGGILRYTLRMGQQPPGPIQLRVVSEFLQATPETVFTLDNYDQDHEIMVVLKDNIDITGNYWMNLVHEFVPLDPSAYDSSIWWTTRNPTLTDVSGWSAAKLWCEQTGAAYPMAIPVLVTENDAEVIYSVILGSPYRDIEDMNTFKAGFQQSLWSALDVLPNRVLIMDVRPAGELQRRLQSSLNVKHGRKLAEANYVEVIFYFLNGPSGKATPSELFTLLTTLADSGGLLEFLPDFLTIERIDEGKLVVSMGTIVSPTVHL